MHIVGSKKIRMDGMRNDMCMDGVNIEMMTDYNGRRKHVENAVLKFQAMRVVSQDSSDHKHRQTTQEKAIFFYLARLRCGTNLLRRRFKTNST